MAEVSIGMPVLNGATTIARALGDLSAMHFQDLEVVVCDNASTDATVEIAGKHAQSDPRVRVVRFDERVDIIDSFRRAFEHTSGPFFMFAPADDRWYPDFVPAALDALKANPEAAACSPRIAFTRNGRFSHISAGTRPLLGGPAANVAAYLRDPGENARAFGLFRREALEGAIPPREYPGWDFQFIARSLSRGGVHLEIPRVLAERDATPYSDYVKQAERTIRSRLLLSVPLHRLLLAVLGDRQIRKNLRVVGALMRLMLASHRAYSALRLPRWSRFLGRVFGPVAPERAEMRPPSAPLGLKARDGDRR